MWLLCSQQFLRAAAMIFFSTWFPTFLRESRGATLEQAGVQFTGDTFDTGVCHMAFFNDPDGMRLEAMVYGPEKKPAVKKAKTAAKKTAKTAT